MKTLLYNPIFINPQAYYVFPNLSRVQIQEVDSTKEPANYIGTIDITTIAYGDIGKVETFTNTNYIDLINFSNSWVRISLHTRIGSVVLGEWKLGNFEKEEPEEPPYIEPDVLASLCGVWIADQNTNESPTRNIIKNKLKDRGGDFEILNAAYKDNSGYGLYKEDFSKWLSVEGVEVIYNKIRVIQPISQWIIIRNNETVNSIKVKISNLKNGIRLRYRYNDNGTLRDILISNGEWTLPASLGWQQGHGFLKEKNTDNITGVIIEQIPEHQGAFVTDGVNDLIVSQKPVDEMLDRTTMNYTVISMTHQITANSTYNMFFTNYIHEDLGSNSYNRVDIDISGSNKTGIYGYYSETGNFDKSCVLGDKEDYMIRRTTRALPNYKFSVEGFTTSSGNIYETSSVAWYWTVIAKDALTEDQINQVIEYFNLDKYVKPDIIYNVKKQGITNDNHAEFGDKLIDYSGNGHDIQLYNIGWGTSSGIGGYREDFTTWYTTDRVPTVELTPTKIVLDRRANAWYLGNMHNDSINAMTVKVSGLSSENYIDYVYFVDGTKDRLSIRMGTDGIYNLPYSDYHRAGSLIIGFFITILSDNRVTIEQLPIGENALVLNGINDYGKVTNLPIYKDYTVVVDREILQTGKSGCLISKNNPGAFLMELGASSASQSIMAEYSFGMVTSLTVNSKRQFSYQSKYLYNGETISAGTDNDTKEMWLGTVRDNDSRFANVAFYSAMLFPYSLSEFLIERQLKKHKLGTMYEDMVQFRPEVSSNVPYSKIEYFDENWNLISVGDYIPINSTININITLTGSGDEISNVILNQGTVLKVEQSGTIKPNIWDVRIGDITKSVLKINITIDEYIRFEDMPQPYPVVITELETIKDVNYHKVTYGGKLKVNKMYRAVKVENLLSGLYSFNYLNIYKGPRITTSKLEELKNLWLNYSNISFSISTTYLLDSNEPKCILSPELLKIPNESYKYLGYIPDISGHGNHGFFNNVGFTDESGADGNGIIHLDGVDDFIRLTNLNTGGKQVFMRCDWGKYSTLLYDQRLKGDGLAILTISPDDTNNNSKIAYESRNFHGDTYIDGIKNKYITCDNLINITHNITSTTTDVTWKTPIIGGNYLESSNFSKMSLYTFMLFDEISTPEKIRELNEIIGINPIIETPPYYYDAYGKSNEDTNKAELTNLGNGGEHTLNIQNVGYEGMSGYGGYPIVFGNNKTYKTLIGANDGGIKYTVSNTKFNITMIHTNRAINYNYVKYAGSMEGNQINNVEVPEYRIKVTGLVGNIDIRFKYIKTDDATAVSVLDISEDGIYTIPKSFKATSNIEAETEWVGFQLLEKQDLGDCNITIEVLPDYPNGLALDGVNDTLVNTTIPALTDFTCIVKRETINKQSKNVCFAYKGAFPSNGSADNAFLYDYKSNATTNSVYSFGRDNVINTEPLISYITPTLVDDKTIIRGTGTDSEGMTIGRWNTYWKGVFYKLMLYPKSLDLLQIRMLKNLFELDEKIDINNPIFKELEPGGGEEPSTPTLDLMDFETNFGEADRVTFTRTSTKLNITNSLKSKELFIQNSMRNFSSPETKVRVTGVQSKKGINFRYSTDTSDRNWLWMEKDGEYILPEVHHNLTYYYTGFGINFAGECDITLEIIK